MGKKRKKKDQKKKPENTVNIKEIVKSESDKEKVRLRKILTSEPSDQFREKKSAFENEVQELWREAQNQGYKTLRGYLSHLYKSWDEEQEILFVSQLYNSYLLAIEIGSEERLGEKIWGPGDTFRDWLFYSRKNIDKRLEELEVDYKTARPSFEAYSEILGDMEDVPGRVGESLAPDERDFYILIMRKSRETIEKVIKSSNLVDRWLQKADELSKQV